MTTIAEELRTLSAQAADDIAAPWDLSARILDRLARRRRRRRIATFAAAVVVATGASLGAARLGGSPYFAEIQTSSAMAPTIRAGETVTYDRDLAPHAGDVVRITLPGRSTPTTSRVIATEGHSVSCPGRADGTCAGVRVDGTLLTDPYLASLATEPFTTVDVPAGKVFVLGDDRGTAIDSRLVGPVGRSAIDGVAVAVARGGHLVAIAGAPRHDVPGDSDPVDPPGPLPTSSTSETH